MVRYDTSVSGPRESSDRGLVPVASMVESIVGCKWSLRLLQFCADGQTRPGAFLRTCPGLSAKVMNERLRKMIRFGIVCRAVFGGWITDPFGLSWQIVPW